MNQPRQQAVAGDVPSCMHGGGEYPIGEALGLQRAQDVERLGLQWYLQKPIGLGNLVNPLRLVEVHVLPAHSHQLDWTHRQ
ncbi:hypothetical protein D3C75_1151270 [compost metagenome]